MTNKDLEEYNNTICYLCENMLLTGSSLFGTSEECSIEAENWYKVLDDEHEKKDDESPEDFCKRICPSFKEGDSQYYSYG